MYLQPKAGYLPAEPPTRTFKAIASGLRHEEGGAECEGHARYRLRVKDHYHYDDDDHCYYYCCCCYYYYYWKQLYVLHFFLRTPAPTATATAAPDATATAAATAAAASRTSISIVRCIITFVLRFLLICPVTTVATRKTYTKP